MGTGRQPDRGGARVEPVTACSARIPGPYDRQPIGIWQAHVEPDAVELVTPDGAWPRRRD